MHHEPLNLVSCHTRHAGTIRHAGFKFGRWLDVAFYQQILATPSEARVG
jgi:L-amino acid N-acyltransferase YncA